jgi:hypothetical protein
MKILTFEPANNDYRRTFKPVLLYFKSREMLFDKSVYKALNSCLYKTIWDGMTINSVNTIRWHLGLAQHLELQRLFRSFDV